MKNITISFEVTPNNLVRVVSDEGTMIHMAAILMYSFMAIADVENITPKELLVKMEELTENLKDVKDEK